MKKLILAVLLLLSINVKAQDTLINNIRVNRVYSIDGPIPQGYIEVTADFILPIPGALIGLNNINVIAESYKSMFGIDRIEGNRIIFAGRIPSQGIWKHNNPQEGLTTDADIWAALEAEYQIYVYKLSMFQLMPFDNVIGSVLIGNTWEACTNE